MDIKQLRNFDIHKWKGFIPCEYCNHEYRGIIDIVYLDYISKDLVEFECSKCEKLNRLIIKNKH